MPKNAAPPSPFTLPAQGSAFAHGGALAAAWTLKGKTALVGGASQGIGRATAIALADLGASVIAMSRSEGPLAELVAQLSKVAGAAHSWLACDVGDRARLGSLLQAELKKRGAIDILICNAGGPKGGPIQEASAEQFEAAFSQHVLANSLMASLCLPGMKERGWGRIVNVISTSVRIPIPNLGVSNTIRAAVASWAKTLSLEVASHGITVNNVLPGYTRTPRLDSLMAATAQRLGKSREQVEADWLATIPAARFGEPHETAAAIAFLASPLAAYVNGVSLAVDGGRTGSL